MQHAGARSRNGDRRRARGAAAAWAAEMALSRNISRNIALMEQKVRTGCWSNEYLRFGWKVYTVAA